MQGLQTATEPTRLLGEIAASAEDFRKYALHAETERRLPPELVRLMLDLGLFRILLPKSFGGLELSMLDALDVIEAVSALDGATGWCLLKGATTNQLAAYLPKAGADEIWADPNIVTAGTFNPKGEAVKTHGGYRLSGRWDWGTGVTHSAWIMASARVVAGDNATSSPSIKTFFVPRADIVEIDTWHTHGMRGTGSIDFSIEDVFVPERRCFDGLMAQAVTPNTLTSPPLAHQIAIPHAGVALGLAQGALQRFTDLALAKSPLMAQAKLADDKTAQWAVGRARALIDSARAHVRESVDRAWRSPEASHALELSLAATHATHACIEAVDLFYRCAGGSAVFSSEPLQKIWRDIHVAGSHFLVNTDKYANAGKAILGAARAANAEGARA